MKKHLQAVFEKEMNRKEFLGYIGAAALAVIGVSGMLKALSQHGSRSSSHQVSSGYGGQFYGGKQK